MNVDTWAATEMIIQGVEEKLQAWFQGQGGREGLGREDGSMGKGWKNMT